MTITNITKQLLDMPNGIYHICLVESRLQIRRNPSDIIIMQVNKKETSTYHNLKSAIYKKLKRVDDHHEIIGWVKGNDILIVYKNGNWNCTKIIKKQNKTEQ